MSLFAEAFAVGAAAMDAVYGEAVTVEPHLSSNGRSLSARPLDPDVPSFDAIAVVDDGAAVNRTPQPAGKGSQPPDVVVEQTTADFDAAQFTGATLPRKGWVLVLRTRAGAPRYRIRLAKPDGTGRLVCTLDDEGTGA